MVTRWTNLLVLDQNGDLYSGSSPIYKSEDRGSTWNLFNDNYFVWSIYRLSKSSIIFGTDCGVYLSEDNGLSWHLTGSFNCGDITAITGCEDDNIIYIGGADRFRGIYYSYDNGQNWQNIMYSDTIRYVTSMELTKERLFFSSYHDGVFTINRSNEELKSFNNGLEYGVSALALDSLGYLYAASDGIYKTSYPVDSTIFNKNSIFNFTLNQNYPNPFNSSTRITYSLRAESNVMLKLFNANGERVVQIAKGVQSKGDYHIIINANTLSSGVYFYQLIAGSLSMTKKMLLIK